MSQAAGQPEGRQITPSMSAYSISSRRLIGPTLGNEFREDPFSELAVAESEPEVPHTTKAPTKLAKADEVAS
jgi:hypothetical protein